MEKGIKGRKQKKKELCEEKIKKNE